MHSPVSQKWEKEGRENEKETCEKLIQVSSNDVFISIIFIRMT